MKNEEFTTSIRALCKFHDLNGTKDEIIIVDTKKNIEMMTSSLMGNVIESISYGGGEKPEPVLKNTTIYKYLGRTIVFIEKTELINKLMEFKPW